MTHNQIPQSAPPGRKGPPAGLDGPSSAAHEADKSAALNSSSAPQCYSPLTERGADEPTEFHPHRSVGTFLRSMFRRPNHRWYSEELPIEIELELFSPGWIDPC